MTSFIGFCRRHLWAVVAALVLVTVAAGFVAAGLRLDSNLTRLLPESAPSVEGLRELEDAYGGQIGRLTVVLEADQKGQQERLEALAERLAPKLTALDDVRRIEEKRPVDFFEKYRLLYASYDDLQTAQKRLEKRIRWEKKRANPLFVPLGDSDPPEVDFSDITDKYQRFDQSAYYVSKDGKRLALFLYPTFPASDLSRAQALSEQVSEVIDAELGGQNGVSFGLSGRYQKRVELQQTLTSDLSLATSVAVVLLVLFLLFFLRSFSAMVVVLVPLISGTTWALAWADIAFGSLNILTGFLGAVLLGVGVDYGIHLYVRYHELRETLDVDAALAKTFATSGRANFFGALTTAIALGSLIISDFRAFYEFGVIALGGIALILMSYMLWMACLVLVADRLVGRLPRPVSQRWTDRLQQSSWKSGEPSARQKWTRLGRRCAIGFAVVVVVGAAGLPRLDFVRSFAALELRNSAAWELDQMVNDMLGQSQTPTVVLTDGPAQSQTIVDEIRQRKENAPGGDTIDKVVSLHTLLPAEQAKKRKLLAQLADDLQDIPKSKRSDKLRSYLDEIEAVLKTGELGPDDLPVALREPFLRKGAGGNSVGGVVLVFPAIDLADIDRVDRFVGVLHDLPGIDAEGRYDAISEAMLLHDIVRLVERDAAWMLAITLVGLIFTSFAAFRRRRDMLVQLGILGAAFVAALGWAGWFDVDINFLNVVIMPIWLGLGIDATFHVIMHLRDEPGHTTVHVATALAVSAAFLTTMIGFGSMLLAHHDGLRSLGEIAVVGLGAVLVVNLLAQFWLVGRQQAEEGADGDAD